jgi:ATP-dependent DNA ligase
VDYFETSAANMVAAAKEQELEGVIAKRRDSLYQPGRRAGAWLKIRISHGQEFVIGGYFPGPQGFDSLIAVITKAKTSSTSPERETDLFRRRGDKCKAWCCLRKPK